MLLEVVISMGLVTVLCLALTAGVTRLYLKEHNLTELILPSHVPPRPSCEVAPLPAWSELLLRCSSEDGLSSITVVPPQYQE
jgi:hypothetical protein